MSTSHAEAPASASPVRPVHATEEEEGLLQERNPIEDPNAERPVAPPRAAAPAPSWNVKSVLRENRGLVLVMLASCLFLVLYLQMRPHARSTEDLDNWRQMAARSRRAAAAEEAEENLLRAQALTNPANSAIAHLLAETQARNLAARKEREDKLKHAAEEAAEEAAKNEGMHYKKPEDKDDEDEEEHDRKKEDDERDQHTQSRQQRGAAVDGKPDTDRTPSAGAAARARRRGSHDDHDDDDDDHHSARGTATGPQQQQQHADHDHDDDDEHEHKRTSPSEARRRRGGGRGRARGDREAGPTPATLDNPASSHGAAASIAAADPPATHALSPRPAEAAGVPVFAGPAAAAHSEAPHSEPGFAQSPAADAPRPADGQGEGPAHLPAVDLPAGFSAAASSKGPALTPADAPASKAAEGPVTSSSAASRRRRRRPTGKYASKPPQ